MRLAVPFDHGEIYGHFGRTAQFKLYDLTDGRIVSTAIVDTMGNSHGALTGFLKAYAVDALICGGIGAGARLALEEAGDPGSIRARPAARMRQSAPFWPERFPISPILSAATTRTRRRVSAASHTCSAACYHEQQEEPCHEPN